MQRIIEILCFIAMFAVVLWSWFKNDGNIKRTVVYTIWTFAIFWFNTPSFFIGVEGLTPKYALFNIPFELYKIFGIWDVVVGNILLMLAGGAIGSSWDRTNYVDEKNIKRKFDRFSKDASELRIIGRDLDFLNNSEYKDQTEHIKKLKDKAYLLCEQTSDPELIELYYQLIQNGNHVRYYTQREGIANLKAQIKIDMHRKESGLFATKIDYSTKRGILDVNNPFEVKEFDSGFLLHTISKEYDQVFHNSLNPVIKCIALDLGGVYFDGDLDDFYQFLSETYSIKIRQKKDDKLRINEKMMLGEMNIRTFIENNANSQRICKKLSNNDWENILKHWGETWTPNNQIKKLMEDISKAGFFIVPFSNLDKDNGNKYLRDYYLPNCCTEHFFSYEQKVSKPSKEAFVEYYNFVKLKFGIHQPYQILLIDDQDQNISTAREQKWYSIKFINGKDSLEYLIDELKKIGILPKEYHLS